MEARHQAMSGKALPLLKKLGRKSILSPNGFFGIANKSHNRRRNAMDPIYLFAKNLLQINYKDLPQEVVEVTKKQVLDLYGVAIAGFTAPGIQELLGIIKDWGGKKESSIILCKQKVPAPMAAQMNATMAHALDFDDVHDAAVLHPGVAVIPACMAVAEAKGKVSGREFITAVALGVDMICRLTLATWPGYDPSSPEKKEKAFQSERVKQGWHLTTVMGYLAAAGAVGKLLGLNEERMINAFGIAYHQCSGNLQGKIDGAQTKRMGPGFSSRAGIASAIMAEKGMTGAKNCLEGKQGFYNMYFQGGYDAKTLTFDLGKHFEGVNVSIKPYPCCRGLHNFIDATLALVSEQAIKAEDVKEIKLFSDEGGYHSLCTPHEVKVKPRTQVDTQFSIPWGVATAIAKKRATIEHFTEAAIKSQDILNVTSKISVELDHSLDRADKIPPGKLEIRMKNGQSFSKQIDEPLGSPERPMSFDDCAKKFRDCSSYPVRKLSKGRIERVIELIGQLERISNVGEIMKPLSGNSISKRRP
jgi:2-methylcitrate dehydratase PrpD